MLVVKEKGTHSQQVNTTRTMDKRTTKDGHVLLEEVEDEGDGGETEDDVVRGGQKRRRVDVSSDEENDDDEQGGGKSARQSNGNDESDGSGTEKDEWEMWDSDGEVQVLGEKATAKANGKGKEGAGASEKELTPWEKAAKDLGQSCVSNEECELTHRWVQTTGSHHRQSTASLRSLC